MPSKTRLPHLPQVFGCILQVNGVDVGSITIYPVYPKVENTDRELISSKTRQTPSTPTFWLYIAGKWGRRMIEYHLPCLPQRLKY